MRMAGVDVIAGMMVVIVGRDTDEIEDTRPDAALGANSVDEVEDRRG